MKSEALQMAKGVRDFGPAEKIARDKIVATLKQVFESFGYNPIETPVLERYELFASKFGIGQESDAMRETFKLIDQGNRSLVLRTEFTVPFSRFVGMNPQLKKPFKRYQMGQVFRDGPIKLGRYREFWQCDVDVVGIGNPLIDAEIIQLAANVFLRLGLEIEFRLNNRKILNSILDYAGVADGQQINAIIAIDKLDKIGAGGVKDELIYRGIDEQAAETILKLISTSGDNAQKIKQLRDVLGDDNGLQEVERTLEFAGDDKNIVFLPSLARGLAYYTGNVFEVYLNDRSKISSSICAGGRYDNMIGGFLESKEEYPAVGISFGLETIFDAIKLKNGAENLEKSVTKVYLISLADEYVKDVMALAGKLREAGIAADVDYLGRKLKNDLEYANSYGIPWVIVLGEDEAKEKKFLLRSMKTGEQVKLTGDEIVSRLK